MTRALMDATIHVYTCMTDPSRRPIAVIGDMDRHFKGDTPMKARKKADKWRREHVRTDKRLTTEQKAELLGEAP